MKLSALGEYDPYRKVRGNGFTIFQVGDFNFLETSGAARERTTLYKLCLILSIIGYSEANVLEYDRIVISKSLVLAADLEHTNKSHISLHRPQTIKTCPGDAWPHFVSLLSGD